MTALGRTRRGKSYSYVVARDWLGGWEIEAVEIEAATKRQVKLCGPAPGHKFRTLHDPATVRRTRVEAVAVELRRMKDAVGAAMAKVQALTSELAQFEDAISQGLQLKVVPAEKTKTKTRTKRA